MNDDRILLDPSPERSPVMRPRRARPASIAGARFGLLDINKARGDVFLDRIEELLRARGHAVNRYAKARFSILAPTELKQKIAAECDIVLEALAD
jgi:hypothetical protein